MDFADLPREMKMKIFRLLLYKDLRRATLVCQEWREVGEDPLLWRELEITLDCGDGELTRTVLRFRRFLFLKKIKLTFGPKTKYCKRANHIIEQKVQLLGVLSCISEHEKTEGVSVNIDPSILTNVPISIVKFDKFTQLWNKLKVLNLKNFNLSPYQIETVLICIKQI